MEDPEKQWSKANLTDDQNLQTLVSGLNSHPYQCQWYFHRSRRFSPEYVYN